MRGDGRIFRPIRNGHALPNWHLAYWGPNPETGTWGEIRESSHTADEDSARRMLRDRIREVANHRHGKGRFVGPRAERITVGELLDALIRDFETRAIKSLTTARSHVRHLRAIFGTDRAIAITTDRVRRYIAVRRDEGAAKATVDRETAQLGRAYNLAIEEGRISFKPRIPMILRANENARQGFFERADFEAVLAEIPDADVRDWLWWFYFTGMRPGGINSLEWEKNFDRETWALRLSPKDDKIGRGLVIPLVGDWRAIIERRIAARRLDSPYIFHRCGKKVVDFGWLWRKACAAANVPGRRIYDLRRTAVRNMIRAGVPQAVAKRISGHQTDSMFHRYNIVSEDDLRGAGESLTAYFATLPGAREVKLGEFPK